MRHLVFLTCLALTVSTSYAQRFVKIVDNVAAMVALNPNDIHNEVAVKFLDTSGAQDTGGIFYYLPLANDATNTTTVFKPNLFSGRWIRANAPSGTGGGGTNGEVAFVDFNPYYFRTNVPTGGAVGIVTNKTVPNWINVRDPPYNALGDTNTDDTLSFSNAITVASAGGGLVYVPSGTYIVNTLTLPNYGSNVWIIGNNPLTTILQSKTTNSPIFKGGLLTSGKGVSRDNRIANISFKANSGGATGNDGTNCFVDCRNISNTKFENIWLLSNGSSGTNTVGFYLYADDSTPVNCYYNEFRRIVVDGQGLGSKGPSVIFRIRGTASSHLITDCLMLGTAIGGTPYVTEFADIAAYCRAITISHNRFEGMALTSTSVIYGNSYGEFIDDNYFENTGSAFNIQPETETGLTDWTVITRNQFASNTVESVSLGRAVMLGNYAVGSTAGILSKVGNNIPRLTLNGGSASSASDPALHLVNNRLMTFSDNAESTAAGSFMFVDANNFFNLGAGNATVFRVNPTNHTTFIGGSSDAGTNTLRVGGHTLFDSSLQTTTFASIGTVLSASQGTFTNSLYAATNLSVGSGGHKVYGVLPGSNITSVTNGDGSITLSSSGGGSGVSGPILDSVVYSSDFAGSDNGSFGQDPDATTYGPVVFNSKANPLQITLPDAGTYEILAYFWVYQPSSFTDFFKLRNTTTSTDLTDEIQVDSFAGQPLLDVTIRAFVTTVSANNVIQIYGKSGDATYGSHYVVRNHSWISYHNLGGGVGFYANGSFTANANLTSSSTATIVASSTNVTAYPTNITDAQIASAAGINATKLGGGVVDNTELATLNGVTSGIQAQIDGKSDVSHTHAFNSITTGTNNNALAAGNFKFTVAQGYQIETLTGVTPSLDWSTQPRKVYAPTTNATYTFANTPSDTNIGKPMWLDITNAAAFSITNTYPAAVRWESDIAPNVLASGKTLSLNFIYNGREVKGFYNTTQTNPLVTLYGGNGLNGSTNGDLHTGNTGGSALNVVTHPGTSGKMPYSTNVAPWITWGDAPSGTGSSFDVTDNTKYYWRETFTSHSLDADNRFGDNPWFIYKLASGGVDRLASEIGHPGIWRFFPDTSITDALLLQPKNDVGGALTEKPYVFGTNSPATTVKFRLRFNTQINGTDDGQFRFGLSDQQGAITNRATNCIIFQINRGDSTTKWGCVTSTNSTATVADSNVAFGTNWVRLTMAISQHATNVVFSIDGSTVATNSTNIPWDTQLSLNIAGHYVAGAQAIAYLDDVMIYEP